MMESVEPVRLPRLVGVIHLPPLPGAPGAAQPMSTVVAYAERDASLLVGGGFDGIIVENYGDTPFHPGAVPPETTAGMAVTVAAVRRTVGDLPVGVNVLRNDARSALAVCAATGAAFIRVNVHAGTMFTDQGMITGAAHETVRIRDALCPRVRILADVHVKHATPPTGQIIGEAAQDTWHRAHADALILTGGATGSRADRGELAQVAEAVPEAPLYVGSGVTPESMDVLGNVHGVIVGSCLKEGGQAGNPVDPVRVREFISAVSAMDAAVTDQGPQS